MNKIVNTYAKSTGVYVLDALNKLEEAFLKGLGITDRNSYINGNTLNNSHYVEADPLLFSKIYRKNIETNASWENKIYNDLHTESDILIISIMFGGASIPPAPIHIDEKLYCYKGEIVDLISRKSCKAGEYMSIPANSSVIIKCLDSGVIARLRHFKSKTNNLNVINVNSFHMGDLSLPDFSYNDMVIKH